MKNLDGKTGFEYGVIAQEVQKEFPEMVYKGSDGYLCVDYIQLIPVMIEAIKELKQEIDALKTNSSNTTVETKTGETLWTWGSNSYGKIRTK